MLTTSTEGVVGAPNHGPCLALAPAGPASNYGANQLLLNDCAGCFVATNLPGCTSQTSALALGDVDVDGARTCL